ncbi:MAG: TIGR03557 family F420-dependent LLM class oxidoreductase [Acidimicrobiales bacterium]
MSSAPSSAPTSAATSTSTLQVGLHLSSEEHDARTLVETAAMAEALGFGSCSISDHYHPWADSQGHSPAVWPVVGGIATATDDLEVGTLVTCPILRFHPALVAQAAATAATMAPGRFFLGVGSGERLNEHVLGQHWPTAGVRLRMLEEAVEVIRRLWTGDLVSHHGEFFTVENARLYDVPDEPPPIYVAAAGPVALDLAGRIGDGLVALSPDAEMVETFREKAGADAPVVGMEHVCVAPSVDEALEVVDRWWPHAGVPSALNAELPLPAHFEAAAEPVTADQVRDQMVLGDDVGAHVDLVRRFAEAGFDRLWIHQIGPDQERAARFYVDDVAPAVESARIG